MKYYQEVRSRLFKTTKSGRVFFEDLKTFELKELDLGSFDKTFKKRTEQFISNPLSYDSDILRVISPDSNKKGLIPEIPYIITTVNKFYFLILRSSC